MADGSVTQAHSWAKFVKQCGPYSDHIDTGAFTGLHQEIVLGRPWLVQTNPNIDCWEKMVTGSAVRIRS